MEVIGDRTGSAGEESVRRLVERYPLLEPCEMDILAASQLLIRCFVRGGMVLVCGNGGSSADAGHIVGELMKGFRKSRPLPDGLRQALSNIDTESGNYLAPVLQGALPAIDLSAQQALTTAFANDQAPDAVFAQQVLGYGKPEHLLLALSTSGNSKNVIYAAVAARSLGMATIAMTGASGGALRRFCDVTIAVPVTDTASVQELHLPVYHELCTIVEAHFFDE